MKRKILAVSLTAAAVMAMTACGTTMNTNPQGAQGETSAESAGGSSGSNELVLYTWANMFPQEVLDGFEEETGVKVIYSNFDTDETMLERLAQARAAIMM